MPHVRRSGYWRATLVGAAMIALSACMPNRFVNGWVPYWDAAEGRVGFSDPATAGMFNDVSPFFFSALPDGTIGLVGSASQLKLTVDAAHARGINVLPSITDGSGTAVMATVILGSTTSRTQHVQNIVDLVMNSGFDGIDLDYEGFAFSDGSASWLTTKPRWVAFVTELASALHANDKLLSVTIPPTWMDQGVVRGYPVYAPEQIGAVADRVKLMVYDWSVSSPGPISPMSWVKLVVDYNDPIVPNHKLQLGIPAYGRDWGRRLNADEICPDGALKTSSVQLENMQAHVEAHAASDPIRHNSGERYFSYDVVETGFSTSPIPAPPYVPPTRVVRTVATSATDTGLQPALRLSPPGEELSCTVRHFVYYPDPVTIQMHAQAAVNAGWGGVVLWALGYETPGVYTALAATTP